MIGKVVEILIIFMLVISFTTTCFSAITRAASITTTNSNTYYVSQTGNDNNAGTSSSPWRTLQKAANSVNPGDTVYVRGGTYNEKMVINRSGTSSAWITFKNYPGETPIVDGTGKSPTYWAGGIIQVSDASYILIDGFKVQDSTASGICVLRSTYVTVQNCQTTNTRYSGIRVCYGEGTRDTKHCTNIKILNNIISLSNTGSGQEALTFSGVGDSEIKYNTLTSSCKKEGIDCKHDCYNIIIAYNDVATPGVNIYVGEAPDGTGGNNFTVYGNYCHGSGVGLGISMERTYVGSNYYFYNNLICGTGNGFQLYEGDQAINGPNNVQFINNVFDNGGAGIRFNPVNSGVQVTNAIIRNNIFSDSNGIYKNSYQSSSEITIDHNFFQGSSSYKGTDYLTGDPKWVNPSTNNYHLQSTSPCINKGSSTSAPNFDYEGYSRPYGTTIDIGAYEYGSTTIVDVLEFKHISPSPTPSTTPSDTPSTTPPSDNSEESINNLITKPTIKGKSSGIRDIEYEYKFVSTDPEGDNIKYCIDWGDGTNEVWIGPYESGQEVSFIHKWSEKGEYIIKAKVMDANGAVSEWTTFKVNIYNPIQKLRIGHWYGFLTLRRH